MCDNEGQEEASGECAPGYYCAGGTTTASMAPCPMHHFCTKRSEEPAKCEGNKEKKKKLLVFLSAYCYTIAIVLTVTLRRRPILNFGPPSTNLTLRIVKYDHSHIINRLNLSHSW